MLYLGILARISSIDKSSSGCIIRAVADEGGGTRGLFGSGGGRMSRDETLVAEEAATESVAFSDEGVTSEEGPDEGLDITAGDERVAELEVADDWPRSAEAAEGNKGFRGKFIEKGVPVAAGGGPLGGGIEETDPGGSPGGNGTLLAAEGAIGGGGNFALINAVGLIGGGGPGGR